MATGECLATLSHTHPVVSLVFTPDGNRLITSSDDRMAVDDLENLKRYGRRVMTKGPSLRLWDIKTKTVVHRFGDAAGYFHDLAITPDGKTLVAINPPTVISFDIGSGKELGPLPQASGADAFTAVSLSLSADGQVAFTAGMGSTVQLWDIRSRRLIQTAAAPRIYVAGSPCCRAGSGRSSDTIAFPGFRTRTPRNANSPCSTLRTAGGKAGCARRRCSFSTIGISAWGHIIPASSRHTMMGGVSWSPVISRQKSARRSEGCSATMRNGRRHSAHPTKSVCVSGT